MSKSFEKRIDKYIENNLNVLVYGVHGVGKTQMLKEAVERHNMKMKYYSCSTLDPFTDLVGIPYPNDERTELHMVRPREIDECDVIIFDELNRAQDSKTLNAILEIVQFGSINGEKLNNLKSCWGIINPPDKEGTYQVRELDPALVDRFDVFEEIKPNVSISYLSNIGINKDIAKIFHDWWRGNDLSNGKKYISPRRVEKMARIANEMRSTDVVSRMVPEGKQFAKGELVSTLSQYFKTGKVLTTDPLSVSGRILPNDANRKHLYREKDRIVRALRNNTLHGEDKKFIISKFTNGISAKSIKNQYKDIWDNLSQKDQNMIFRQTNRQKQIELVRSGLV